MKIIKEKVLNIAIGIPIFIFSLFVLFFQLTLMCYLIYITLYFNALYPIIGIIISSLSFGSLIKHVFRTISYNKVINLFIGMAKEMKEENSMIKQGYRDKEKIIKLCKESIKINTKDVLVRSIIPITITTYFILIYAGRV